MKKAVLVIGLGGIAAGAGLVGAGWQAQEPPAAPLPSATFDLGAQEGARPVVGGSVGGGHTGRGSGSGEPASGSPAGEGVNAAWPTPGPNRIVVPSLGIDAQVSPADLGGDGGLVVPGDPSRVGLWTGGAAATTAVGTTLLAGHVDSDGRLGALHPLASITPRARIVTTDARGVASRWRVVALQVRDKDDVPSFPKNGPRRLAVVTCGGPVVHTSHGQSYADNVVVTAEPVE